jgi:hypothetical protein
MRVIKSLILLSLMMLMAISAGFGQAIKQIKIGSLQNWFADPGCEPEEKYVLVQQYGLTWPSQYFKQDNQAAKALWIASSNFTDAPQYGGNTFPYKVVHCGPRSWDTQRETIPVMFKMYGRFPHPNVYVDGLPSSDLTYGDEVEEINPNLQADRLIVNVVNTSLGLTMTRRIYAFSQQYHDNYFIYDYTFKNTGNVDADADIEKPGQKLTDVYFFWQYRYATAREGCESDATTYNSTRWGKNEMLSTRGEARAADSKGDFVYKGDYADWLNGVKEADSLRCQMAWKGRFSGVTFDFIGIPDVKYGTGRFMGPQFVGVVTLHADKSAADKTDDPKQPVTTTYYSSDDDNTRSNDQFDGARMTSEWKWITSGHRLPRHDQAVGEGYADNFEGTPGGYSNMNGYGPYTLAFGDSVRIVMAEGVAGLSRKMCEDLGKEWLKGYKNTAYAGPYTLPNGSTTTNKDIYKNTWVFTGKDSLFKTFGRARRNFNNKYTIPTPPPPPLLFNVSSGGDRIMLSWDNTAESWPGFSGYEVYRSIAKYDTVFEKIFTCGKLNNSAVANSFDDRTAQRGQSYYYYICSYDDGRNNDPSKYSKETAPNPGGILRSNMFWTRTTQPAYLRRAPESDLAKIRVVPNPFNTRAAKLQYLGEPDKLMFLNIPGECTIKIFTERGDLVKTIEHKNGSGDESWNSNTEFGQVVVSGVYIAVFETPDGQRAIRKFVIIR